MICDRLLDEVPDLTTGQLADKIKRLAIALDPDWARRLYKKRVQRRYVEGKLARDGTGQITGKGLPAADAASACNRIDQLAADTKRAGDPRTMDQLRADLFLALLDGTLEGRTSTQITAWMTSHPHEYTSHNGDSDGTDHPAGDGGDYPEGGDGDDHPDDGDGNDGDHPDDNGDHGQADHDGNDDGNQDEGPGRPAGPGRAAGGQAGNDSGSQINGGVTRTGDDPGHDGEHEHPEDHHSGDWDDDIDRDGEASHNNDGGAGARSGVELRAGFTTLLGLDDHPGEMPGYGPVLPDEVRTATRRHARSQWTYAITDGAGQLLADGLIRSRPQHWRRDAPPRRGGTVEVQVRLDDLARLHDETKHGVHHPWAPVITELIRHAGDADLRPGDSQHRNTSLGGRDREADSSRAGPEPRTARGQLRRHVQARARWCLFTGCRHSAKRCHVDHRRQWQHGGPTKDANLDPLCPHDHDAKDEGGWQIIVSGDGTKIWISPLSYRYTVQPKPVLDDLPGPLARDHDPWDLATERNDGDTRHPCNAEPSWGRQTEPRPQPPASPRYIELDDPGETPTTPLTSRPPPGDTAAPDTPPF